MASEEVHQGHSVIEVDMVELAEIVMQQALAVQVGINPEAALVVVVKVATAVDAVALEAMTAEVDSKAEAANVLIVHAHATTEV